MGSLKKPAQAHTAQTLPIAIIGLNALCREGLAQLLERAGFRVIASAAAVADLQTDVMQNEVLILINAGNTHEAIEQVKQFKGQRASWRVVVLADALDVGAAFSSFQAGANAYLVSLASSDALAKSLELVMLGQMILPEGLLPPLTDFDVGYTKHNHEARRNEINGCEMPLLDLESDNCKMRQLTLCEKRILRCLVEGDSNKVIARKRDIAEATVKVHIKAILRKIQVQNRTQAAVWGINHAINVWSLGMPEHGGAGPEHKRKFEAAS